MQGNTRSSDAASLGVCGWSRFEFKTSLITDYSNNCENFCTLFPTHHRRPNSLIAGMLLMSHWHHSEWAFRSALGCESPLTVSIWPKLEVKRSPRNSVLFFSSKHFCWLSATQHWHSGKHSGPKKKRQHDQREIQRKKQHFKFQINSTRRREARNDYKLCFFPPTFPPRKPQPASVNW